MKKATITICFLLAGTLAQAQQALEKYQAALQALETQAESKTKSDERGKALAHFFDSRIAEANKGKAIEETLPYFRQLIDYDFLAAYKFLMRVKNQQDMTLFMNNYLSKDEQNLIRAVAKHTTLYANTLNGPAYPSNVPPPGKGLKGNWQNIGAAITSKNSIVTKTPVPGMEEFNKGYTAYKAQNYTEAMNWFIKSAEKGNANGMESVGLLYLEGSGVEKSFTTALGWYKKALLANPNDQVYKDMVNKMSNGNAEYVDGVAFYKAGEFNKAKVLFLAAEQMGHLPSTFSLGAIYYEIEKDYNKGILQFQKAADKGYKEAKEALQIIKEDEMAAKASQQLKAFKGTNGKYGFQDSSGKEIVSPKYHKAKAFSEGMAAVSIMDAGTEKWGYINETGKEVTAFIYGDALPFSEGLAAARPLGKTWDAFYGFIDKTGKLVIPHDYPFIFDMNMSDGWSFKNGKAKVYKDKRFFFIDKTGKEVK